MKNLIDQSAHLAVSFLLIAILAPAAHPFTCALVGLAMGLIREITEDVPITSRGSLLDLLFWTLGGLAAGLLPFL